MVLAAAQWMLDAMRLPPPACTKPRAVSHIFQALESELAPRGIAVVVEARHLCYAHDGASTAGSSDPLAAPPHPRRATAATSGLFCDPALGHFDDLLCFLGLEEPSAAPEAVKPSAVLPGAPPLCSHSCCSSSSDALGRAGAAGGALEACCGPVGANLSPLVTPVLSDDLVRGEDEGEGSGSDTCEHGRCCCDSSSGSSALGPGSDMALSAGSDMALSVGSAPSCSASDAEPDGVALALADDEAAACSCGCSATGCGCAGSGGCGRGMCSGDPMQLDARWQAVAGPLGTSQQLALARWQAVNGAAPTAPATPPLPGAPAAAAAAGAATEADMQAAVAALLAELGEDPRRPGLRATAAQYVAALLASTSGYTMPAPLPEAAGGEPAAPAPAVQEFHAPFTSQCEHHMLPFHGSAHIVCLDGRRHLSPSAAAALVARFTRRLQVQERITHQLADAFAGATDASGVLVVCSAVHMCMVARGVENHAGATCTTAVRGTAASDPAVRAQCMRLVRPQLRAAAAAAGADGSGC